jgi:histidinol-phosphatase (PHP family)
MPADYHLHTPLCHHATGAPIEYVAAARARGLDEIGFSDHSPMPGPEPFDEWRMTRAELPRYLDLVAETAQAAAPFPVRLGLECDFIAGQESWIEELAGRAPWDYLIGSVHYLAPRWDVDNPRWIGRFTASETAVEEIWTLYWREYERCIASGLFDFVAHPDLVKKFGHRPAGDLRRFYDPAIAAAAVHGTAVEYRGIAQAGW